jgi:hypothetical protein
MPRLRTLVLTLGLALGLALGLTSPAFADALVVVEVRGPDGTVRDGQVTLRPASGGSPRSCQTANGTCRIADVADPHRDDPARRHRDAPRRRAVTKRTSRTAR